MGKIRFSPKILQYPEELKRPVVIPALMEQEVINAADDITVNENKLHLYT